MKKLASSNLFLTPSEPTRLRRTLPAVGFAPSTLDWIAEHVGKDEFLRVCRLAESPNVKEFVCQWDKLSKREQAKTPLGDLCQRAGLDARFLIEEAVSSFSHLQSLLALLLNATALPGLMRASIQAALTPEGVRDREIQFMIGGLLGQTRQVYLKVLKVRTSKPNAY